jgi:hypothetical protein
MRHPTSERIEPSSGGRELRPASRPRTWRAAPLALLLVPLAAACTGHVGSSGTNPGAGTGGGSGSGTGSQAGSGSTSGKGSGGTGLGAGTGATPGAGTGGAPGVGSGGAAGGSAVVSVIPNKGIHRLSNIEYDNTVRDLLNVDPGYGRGFVVEEADGFDNLVTALSMSPRQVEDYFSAGRDLSAAVFKDTTLRGRIVSCDPAADSTCAQKVITTFGRRAFRRPLTSEESTALLAKYQEARTLGADPLGSLQHVVHVMLVSPQFLYRIEADPSVSDTSVHPLNGYELASRLSYALWSSMPDDALLADAESGKLGDAATLDAQVDRMLADSRSDMLVQNFAAQWFGSRRLGDHVASTTIFPTWSPALATSMQREMELYFAEFLRKDLSFADFLTTDINFVDTTLAAYYGVAAPAGTGFQRVVNTTDQRRGFLGLAGFLTHTSRETRSSPIIRGKWILDSVWCRPLRLPPNLVVEPLPEPVPGDTSTTIRDQIAAHRSSAACAGCHDVIDPIGLALENFDGIGRYRATYENGVAIDTSGMLPGGKAVAGFDSLTSLLGQDPQFLACAAHKFGTYALGLDLATENRDQILARWMTATPTLKNLIKETVRHDMFRTRRAEGQ